MHRLTVAAAALLLLVACGEDPAGTAGSLPASVPPEDPGLVHVHGVGVNPADELVYVATHFGLWRLGDGGRPERVGRYFYDFMGFTVAGPDHFLASGHPLPADDLPALLGLVESIDGGETWRSVALLGDVDFHALRAEHGMVYGWSSSDGAFMVSPDGGHTWERRSTRSGLLDFAVDPADPDRLVATVAEGPQQLFLASSDDGGRSWKDVEGPPLARLAWPEAGHLTGAAFDGGVWRSADGGVTWERVGNAPAPPEALLDTGERMILAAAGAILESTDAGATWAQRAETH